LYFLNSDSAIATNILANSGNEVSKKPLQDPNNMDNALQRFGDPEEVAESLVWITSGRASYITAAVLAVNGGQLGV
jgi:NAD(P)-dependent dehydrogenase (short-subunit alcohol dehydrogenase family)